MHLAFLDMISYSHVVVALFAAKFLSSDSICQRRIGVMLFEVPFQKSTSVAKGDQGDQIRRIFAHFLWAIL
jgi:hypothetical protein